MQGFRPPRAGQLGEFVRLRVSLDQLLLPLLAAVLVRHPLALHQHGPLGVLLLQDEVQTFFCVLKPSLTLV